MGGSHSGPVPGKEQSQTANDSFPMVVGKKDSRQSLLDFFPGHIDLLMANNGNFFAAEHINTVFIFCGLFCREREKKSKPQKNQVAVSESFFIPFLFLHAWLLRAHIFMEDPNTGSNHL